MTESFETHRRLAQALIVTSAALLLWAAAVAITGGFRVELGVDQDFVAKRLAHFPDRRAAGGARLAARLS